MKNCFMLAYDTLDVQVLFMGKQLAVTISNQCTCMGLTLPTANVSSNSVISSSGHKVGRHVTGIL